MAKHSKGVKKGEFCAVRKAKCDCGNKYQENCTPPPIGWSDDIFLQGSKIRVEKKYEAHHLLCVACVTAILGKNEKIESVVKQTKWCINAEQNMFAMPLWGHTIQWYCNLAESGEFFDRKKGPKFENLPQHDYDHNSKKGYKSEVDDTLTMIADEIQQLAEEDHDAAVKELKATLDDLSSECRAALQERGKRTGGTHKAWQQGSDDPRSNWYLPFSMAASATKRYFPAPGITKSSKLGNKIKRLARALQRWGEGT